MLVCQKGSSQMSRFQTHRTDVSFGGMQVVTVLVPPGPAQGQPGPQPRPPCLALEPTLSTSSWLQFPVKHKLLSPQAPLRLPCLPRDVGTGQGPPQACPLVRVPFPPVSSDSPLLLKCCVPHRLPQRPGRFPRSQCQRKATFNTMSPSWPPVHGCLLIGTSFSSQIMKSSRRDR